MTAAVEAVAPRATYGVYGVTGQRCERLAGVGTRRVLPIASVFKLWILHAVAREVAAGRARWDETYPVRDELRSDPSGEVYAMPAGTRVSLRRLAELMISISDNTAADHLLARVGRALGGGLDGRARDLDGQGQHPAAVDGRPGAAQVRVPAYGERYLRLRSVPERRRFLERLPDRVPFPWAQTGTTAAAEGSASPDTTAPAVPPPDLSRPRLIDDLEWFATAGDLCRTMVALDRLAARPATRAVGEILALNPGLPPDLRAEWETVRFKGGSEPGVLTFVHSLRRHDGTRRVVVLAWSDPDGLIPESPAGENAFRSVLRLAHDLRTDHRS